MTLPLCRLCPKPAHFNFREGILLCAECAADVLELCKISTPSACATADVSAPAAGADDPAVGANQSPITADQHKYASQPLQVTEHDGIPDFLRRTG